MLYLAAGDILKCFNVAFRNVLLPHLPLLLHANVVCTHVFGLMSSQCVPDVMYAC